MDGYNDCFVSVTIQSPWLTVGYNSANFGLKVGRWHQDESKCILSCLSPPSLLLGPPRFTGRPQRRFAINRREGGLPSTWTGQGPPDRLGEAQPAKPIGLSLKQQGVQRMLGSWIMPIARRKCRRVASYELVFVCNQAQTALRYNMLLFCTKTGIFQNFSVLWPHVYCQPPMRRKSADTDRTWKGEIEERDCS